MPGSAGTCGVDPSAPSYDAGGACFSLPASQGCATQKWQIARIPFLWRVSECLDTLSTRRPPLMPNSLPELEAERSKLLRQFTTLGDLRPGSICAVPRRCGKPTCHCAKPNDPGHDPQIRLTRKIDGKTVAESFPSAAAWRKAQSEIDEHHRFQQLSTELISVNEKICKIARSSRRAAHGLQRKKNGCCDP